ncbi:MAG: hypothetical protein QOI79_4343, partial [Mycobacterium sp.]|nr:hypothetical protein [Mycobacterium sp.]
MLDELGFQVGPGCDAVYRLDDSFHLFTEL